jgi:uncharacterized MAPEG superfamily protein
MVVVHGLGASDNVTLRSHPRKVVIIVVYKIAQKTVLREFVWVVTFLSSLFLLNLKRYF